MKTAYTTKQIEEQFSEDTESYTCSILCDSCISRIWFFGDLYDKDTPVNFNCPYCGLVTENEHKAYEIYKRNKV